MSNDKFGYPETGSWTANNDGGGYDSSASDATEAESVAENDGEAPHMKAVRESGYVESSDAAHRPLAHI